jgi:hypothetical protein
MGSGSYAYPENSSHGGPGSGVGIVLMQGTDHSWSGDFAEGDYLNYTQNAGAITLNFTQGYSQVGAQIMSAWTGAFTAQICDNNGFCWTENGNDYDPSAMYIGISGTDITWVTFNVTSAPNAPNDFAINQVTLGSDPLITDTPEPSSLLLFGTGLMGLVGGLRRKFAR